MYLYNNLTKIALPKLARLYKGGNTEKRGRGAPLLASSTGKKARSVYIVGNEATCGNGPSYFAYLNSGLTTLLSYLSTVSETNTASVRINYCKPSWNLSGSLNLSTTYSVSNSIVSTQNIGNAYSVRYQAGTFIELNPGFVSGTNFVAEINPCVSVINVIAAKTEYTEANNNLINATHKQTDSWLKIYPTILPSCNSITVEAKEALNGVEIMLYDLQNKHIRSFRLNEFGANTSVSIPLVDITSGLYVLKAQDATHLFTQKIVIQ